MIFNLLERRAKKMGRYAGRFVVDTHVHAQRAVGKFKERGIDAPSTSQLYAEVPSFKWVDNSERLLYDMERYGIDMCVIQSGGLARGSDSDMDLNLVERYPDKFVALAYPTTFLNKVASGKVKWSLEGALEETEARLKTGKYRGIGQGLPITEMGGAFEDIWAKKDSKKKVEILTDTERLDRYRLFMDLAEKYNVAVAGVPHDERILPQLASEYPDVPMVLQLVGFGRRASVAKVDAFCNILARNKNIYFEMCAPAELYEIALSDPNVGPTQIIIGTDWGASYYVYSQPGRPIRGQPFTSYGDWISKWGPVRYQNDAWGWTLHQIDRLRDTLTQDELNLILGGNAARIFKLDVPYTRLFPEGRPDLWGVDWQKSIPFIPNEQIKGKRKNKKE
jgi:hypothetical protein